MTEPPPLPDTNLPGEPISHIASSEGENPIDPGGSATLGSGALDGITAAKEGSVSTTGNASQPHPGAITQHDKITILMHEYDTLRDEIIQRNNALQQQNSIAAVVLFGTLTILWSSNAKPYQSYILYGLIALGIIIWSYGVWFAFRENGRVIVRLRELEADVNARAGETLLQWETHWGWAAISHWGRSKPQHRLKKNSK